jgi:hypothetical protein
LKRIFRVIICPLKIYKRYKNILVSAPLAKKVPMIFKLTFYTRNVN